MAEEEFDDILHVAAFHVSRGNMYAAKGQIDRAIKDYAQAIKLKPDYSKAYGSRAIAYKALGQIEKAKADAKKALDLNPNATVPTF